MTEIEPLVDITGATISVGDTVVYPQMSGRCVQMVLGTLVEWNGKTAKIQRIEGGRWSASYAGTRYRDKRTGKGISIWTADYRHWEVPPKTVYIHRQTKKEISKEEYYSNYRHGDYVNYEEDYRRGTLKDYVEEYTPPAKPVTIHNVENIVRVSVKEVDVSPPPPDGTIYCDSCEIRHGPPLHYDSFVA